MSSVKLKGSGNRSGVKKMIEDMQEITGWNHSDDEIHAMLRECSMDPNEAAHRLLLLDKFHEVKSKRDRRKENQSKELSETKWKPGTQARANREGHVNYSQQYKSNDAGDRTDLASSKEIGLEKGVRKSISSRGTESVNHSTFNAIASMSRYEGLPPASAPKDSIKGSKPRGNQDAQQQVMTLGNSAISNASYLSVLVPPRESSSCAPVEVISSKSTKKRSASAGDAAPEVGFSVMEQNVPNEMQALVKSQQLDTLLTKSSAISYSAIRPSANSNSPSPAGDAAPEVGFSVMEQSVPNEMQALVQSQQLDTLLTKSSAISSSAIRSSANSNNPSPAGDAAPEVGFSVMEQNVPNEMQALVKSQQLDTLPTKSSAVSSSAIRPSANSNNPSRVTGSQKVGPVKEWKPKSVIISNGESATRVSLSEFPLVSTGSQSEMLSPGAVSSKEATLDLQKQLEKLIGSETKHVIIPDHLHVPEVEKLGLCFGSFDSIFGLDLNKHVGPGSDESLPISRSSEYVDERVTETQMSNLNESVPVDNTEAEYPEPLESHLQGPESLKSGVVEALSSSSIDTKDVAPGTHQLPASHAPSNYNLTHVQSTLTSQFAPTLSSDSQDRDAPRQPAFSMPQSVDPSTYYGQLYRSATDANGHSPFHTSRTSMKNSGSVTLVSSQAPQIPQEFQAGFPLILSSASPPQLVTQAAGVMQSSINPVQQPLPVFRQPPGVVLPHYNYIPYGPNFSPYYVLAPTVNPFLSNAFPQQLQPGSLHQTANGTIAKYSPSLYKQGSNTVAPNHTGLPVNYGSYGLPMANYPHGSATAPITSASKEDNAASQAKESNIYASGQQNLGSSGWVGTPNREMPAVEGSSLYNLPQAQLAFTPTQLGHGTFTRFLHPAQAMTSANINHPLLQQSQTIITIPADIGGGNATVYQQPHHAQVNWPGNY